MFAIKNQGITQTIMYGNNGAHVNQLNWTADYDGNMANIMVNSNVDGKQNAMKLQLNNADLYEMLNRPTVNIPIDKRLLHDFHLKPKPLLKKKLIMPLYVRRYTKKNLPKYHKTHHKTHHKTRSHRHSTSKRKSHVTHRI
jgi:hypothetical protein